jgi:NAD(P)H-flavin reductase
VVDARRLQESWSAVTAHGDQVPLFFYSTLFLTNPDIREMFPVGMATQRDRVVSALGHVVSHLDDLDAVVPTLQQLGRDHRRFGVASEHYPAVGEALLATLEHFSGAAWTSELAADWAAAYGLVADIMRGAAKAASDQPAWWELTVAEVDRRAPGVVVLTVVPHAPLPYQAGQSIAIEVPMRPRLWRYLTPATLPAADGSFELHVRLVPGGQVSTALVQAVQRGDVLRAGAPVGTGMTLPPGPPGDLVMLAGGTGLAPMKVLIQHLQAVGSTASVRLYWGTHTARDQYDLPAIRRLAEQLDWLQVVPCLSHDPAAADGSEPGAAVDVALRHGPWPDRDHYVCGSPEMVRGTVDALARAGVAPERTHVEEFASKETAR